MSDELDSEIEMMEREGYQSPRWQRGLAWLRELRDKRSQLADARARIDELHIGIRGAEEAASHYQRETVKVGDMHNAALARIAQLEHVDRVLEDVGATSPSGPLVIERELGHVYRIVVGRVGTFSIDGFTVDRDVFELALRIETAGELDEIRRATWDISSEIEAGRER